jgi:hypothetical protein
MRRCRRWSLLAYLIITIACLATSASAHGLATTQLVLRVTGASVTGQWDIQTRDALIALGVDPPQSAEPAGTLANDQELRAYLGRHLSLEGDGSVCPLVVTPAPATESGHLLFRIAADCPSQPTHLTVRCDLLFDRDAKHRAYFSVEDERVTHVGVFRYDLRSVTLDIHQSRPTATVAEFVREGVAHIGSGLDHILFLLALLLPAPLLLVGKQWTARDGLGPSIREVVKVVTAFTVAHSITLGLSFFGVVTPPARWIEVAIAVSVFAAAWNNLRPFLPGRAWVMALLFGLVHGFGFAGALGNLSLPLHARGLALGAFNVGVELGQLAIVLLVLPFLYRASRRRWYPRLVMGGGSFAIAWLAVVWVLERGLGLTLLS